MGPLFDYSENWQLVINTGITIVTFLMVFLIQRSQNKDSLVMHLKLNEPIAATKGASNRFINAQDLKPALLPKSPCPASHTATLERLHAPIPKRADHLARSSHFLLQLKMRPVLKHLLVAVPMHPRIGRIYQLRKLAQQS